MSPEEICNILTGKFAEAVTAAVLEGSHPHAVVAAERWPEVARFLRDEPRLRFNMLRCISSLDLLAENKFAAIYDLLAVPLDGLSQPFVPWRHEFAVRVIVDRDAPHIPSVADVWPAADWHEREAYDLMGIVFDHHPDSVVDEEGVHPRRILCADDWVGHPLRKDYVFPIEYHGIPATTEYELTNPKH
jgi:NADH-quinone oxidoreductase subunit C